LLGCLKVLAYFEIKPQILMQEQSHDIFLVLSFSIISSNNEGMAALTAYAETLHNAACAIGAALHAYGVVTFAFSFFDFFASFCPAAKPSDVGLAPDFLARPPLDYRTTTIHPQYSYLLALYISLPVALSTTCFLLLFCTHRRRHAVAETF